MNQYLSMLLLMVVLYLMYIYYQLYINPESAINNRLLNSNDYRAIKKSDFIHNIAKTLIKTKKGNLRKL